MSPAGDPLRGSLLRIIHQGIYSSTPIPPGTLHLIPYGPSILPPPESSKKSSEHKRTASRVGQGDAGRVPMASARR